MRSLVVVGTVLALCMPVRASVIVIDDFSPPSLSITVPTLGFDSLAGFVAGGLGGQRDLAVSRPAGSSITQTGTIGDSGFLKFVTTGTGDSGTVVVHWDGTPAGDSAFSNNTGLSLVDFTVATGAVFWITAPSAPTGVTLSLTVYNGTGGGAVSETQNFGSFANVPELGLAALIPFSAFSTVNLAQVTGLSLTIFGNSGGDVLNFDAIGAGLPEPTGALGFALVGLPIVGAWRRMRRK